MANNASEMKNIKAFPILCKVDITNLISDSYECVVNEYNNTIESSDQNHLIKHLWECKSQAVKPKHRFVRSLSIVHNRPQWATTNEPQFLIKNPINTK